jgi:probable non-F420 flavinoid oxidoreductase
MTIFGFHASHEELPPEDLLAHVVHAEDAGFTAAMCSDHLAPWSLRQGESGHSWAWLGAAMARTSLPFGVVTCPVGRQHPAVVAQAAATLELMFPGRFWLALGSGEALNEMVTGEEWPEKAVRDRRLDAAARAIQRLLAGERVSTDEDVRMRGARVYSRPEPSPPVIGAAATATTARRVASWADGLVTFNRPLKDLREVVDAWRDAAGDRPLFLQVHVSWAPTRKAALANAHHHWRTNVFAPEVMWELASPEQFDAVAEHVRPDDMHDAVVVSPDLDEHVERVREFLELGIDAVYLHQVGREQHRFIDAFGEHVLPALAGAGQGDRVGGR